MARWMCVSGPSGLRYTSRSVDGGLPSLGQVRQQAVGDVQLLGIRFQIRRQQGADDVIVEPGEVGGDVAAGLHVQPGLQAFIDDLDRCLPDTAIETLEAVRLFVFTSRTAFIVAADEAMRDDSIKRSLA